MLRMTATAAAAGDRRRMLVTACLAHLLHDGYTSMVYLLLPFWQRDLTLSLVEIGLLKTLYSGAMAAGQIPAGMIGERRGERSLLVVGTLLAAIAVAALHGATSFAGLGMLLMLAGIGASVQHPLASALIARRYGGPTLRTVLGTYNFSGDLGKMTIPGLLTLLIAAYGWRSGTEMVSSFGFAIAALLLIALPGAKDRSPHDEKRVAVTPTTLPTAIRRRGFVALSAIGMLDSATRTGVLTFLPFVLAGKGADIATVGTALALVFAGGAAGKFACGALATRVGILRTVILTETATAAAIVALLASPLSLCPVLMPPLGLALNGTSSVLYGTVPELAQAGRTARAFGVFYTVTIAADAIAPTFYGAIGDWFSLSGAMLVVAAIVLLILPLTLGLKPALRAAA